MSEKKYRIERVEQQDPLDHLPDVSEQTGGLPIVTFVLVCLAACAVILVRKILASTSILVSAGCVVFLLILIFGVTALVRGMFRKLQAQKEPSVWYKLSALVMAAGCILGVLIGMVISV